MRKIRIAEHISLDGVIEPDAPDEDSEYARGGWTAPYRTAEGAAAIAGIRRLKSHDGPGLLVCGSASLATPVGVLLNTYRLAAAPRTE